jgi:hypothetical protein
MPATNSVSYPCGTALLEIVCLNAISFSNPTALFINLSSNNLKNLKNIRALVDSGSTDCFIDSRFTLNNNLKIENLVTPLHLTLFDGSSMSSGLIYQFTQQTLHFPCRTSHDFKFLLTALDQSASAVLGYSWLCKENLLIDWVNHDITFWTTDKRDHLPPVLTPPSASIAPPGSPPAATPVPLPLAPLPHVSQMPLAPELTPTTELRAATAKIPISFVRAAAI